MPVTQQGKTLTDFPQYVTEKGNLARLRTTETHLKSQIGQAEDALKRDADQTRDDVAGLMLAGREYQDALRNRRENTDSLTALRDELTIVQRAIGRQEAIVSTERGNASRLVCQSVKAVHDALQREMALAITAAAKASLGAQTLRSDLAAGDVQIVGLEVITFRGIDNYSTVDACSGLAYFIRESLEAT